MPTTESFKECAKRVRLLPRRQQTVLTESLLQDAYERQCLEKNVHSPFAE